MSTTPADGRRSLLVVFAVAYAVRLVYLYQIRDAPYFDVPLVDGPNYFRLAHAIASGSWTAGRQIFWQPPLYPYFLALLFKTVGTGMETIYAVQTAVGSLSCVLVLLIGRRLFGERAGLLAGIVAALYGPLVHFDAQPLVPFLHIALVLGGLAALLRAGAVPGPAPAPRRESLGAGLLWGLAAIATPNILAAAPIAGVWLWRRLRGAAAAGIFLLGVALPVGCVTARNYLVAGEPVLISSNGGINFFIGNNPDYERTIRLRPGGEFERLAQEPENLGIVKAAARSRYFTERALRYLRDSPREASRLYVRKAADLVAGREIPRNQDAYVYRRESSLFALLLWRFGVSFPFGVVAPLALAGVALGWRGGRGAPGADAGRSPGSAAGPDAAEDASRRSGRALVLLYAAAYTASILLFFPTDRYRLPLVPVAALFAGHLLAALPGALVRPRVAAALVAGLVLFNLDAFRTSESYPEEEALNKAYALRMKGRLDEARAAYEEAIGLNPRRIDPYNALATLAAERGRWDEAARRYEDLLAIAPDFAEVRRSLGEAYMALGRKEDARREWRTAATLAPGDGLALAALCLSFHEEGFSAAAEPYCERAVAARPDLPETHLAMGLVARALRRRDRARAELSEAARLFPPGSAGRRRAEEILERMRRRDERPMGDPGP